MNFLKGYYSALLPGHDLGDCSLCDIPMEIKPENESTKPQKFKHKQLIDKNFFKKVSIYFSMPLAAAYILLMQLIGE